MPEFNYKAVDKKGKQHSSSCYAVDEAGLENELKEKGFWLIDATKVKTNKKKAQLQQTTLNTQNSSINF